MSKEFPLKPRRVGKYLVSKCGIDGSALYLKPGDAFSDSEISKLGNILYNSLKINGYGVISGKDSKIFTGSKMQVSVPKIQSRRFDIFLNLNLVELEPSFAENVNFCDTDNITDKNERKAFKEFLKDFENILKKDYDTDKSAVKHIL